MSNDSKFRLKVAQTERGNERGDATKGMRFSWTSWLRNLRSWVFKFITGGGGQKSWKCERPIWNLPFGALTSSVVSSFVPLRCILVPRPLSAHWPERGKRMTDLGEVFLLEVDQIYLEMVEISKDTRDKYAEWYWDYQRMRRDNVRADRANKLLSFWVSSWNNLPPLSLSLCVGRHSSKEGFQWVLRKHKHHYDFLRSLEVFSY